MIGRSAILPVAQIPTNNKAVGSLASNRGINWNAYWASQAINYITTSGKSVAWYDRTIDEGVVKDEDGKESIYWDLLYGSSTYDDEQSTGDLVLYAVYKIIATEEDFFYTGCAVGDVFPCGTVKTCDANNKVVRILGNHATQPVLSKRPTNGLFDGTSTFMKTATFSYSAPEQQYVVMKNTQWLVNRYFTDGGDVNSLALNERTATPSITLKAGGTNSATVNNNLSVNTLSLINALCQTGDSRSRINSTPFVAHGALNIVAMNGITIGSNAAGNGSFAKMQFYEGIWLTEKTPYIKEKAIFQYIKYKYEIPDTLTFNKPKLIFTTDGWEADLYTDYFPCAVENGLKFTHYITTGRVDGPDHVTTAQLIEMYNQGQDIQDHSAGIDSSTHNNLTELTEEQIIAEMDAVNAWFAAAGIPVPKHIAYPFGDYNATVIGVVENYRLTGRTIENPLTQFKEMYKNLDGVSTKYMIWAEPIDGLDAAGIAALKAKLDMVATYNTAIIFYSHIWASYIPDLIDYSKQVGFDILPMSEFYELLD